MAKQQSISDEKSRKLLSREKRPIEIRCGGRCFASPNGYKYWGTCSNSYSIPQIAGLFALAKQINPELSFEQFEQIANQTAFEVNESNYGRLIISPEELVEKVFQMEEISKYHDQKSDGTFRVIETGIHTITGMEVKNVAGNEGVIFEKENCIQVINANEREEQIESERDND